MSNDVVSKSIIYSKKKSKFPCELILLLPTFISIREIIAIALTVAKRTDFIDKPAPVDGPDTNGCDDEVSSFSHGKRYRNDLSEADNMLGHKNYAFCY